MSLKIFHICFIILSVLLAAGCALWGFTNENAPVFGWVAAIAGVAMIIYGIWFLKKTKKLIL